jgi:hypothetical protein
MSKLGYNLFLLCQTARNIQVREIDLSGISINKGVSE